MKVLVLGYGVPGPSDCRYGQFILNQAIAIKNFAHENLVVYGAIDLRSVRHKRKLGVHNVDTFSIPVIEASLPLGRVPNCLKKFVSCILFRVVLKKFIKRFGTPDIVHAHFASTAFSAARLKEKFHYKLVVTEHSSGINQNPMDQNLYKICPYVYKQADALIAVSPSLSNRIKECFGYKALFIPNMINEELFCFEGAEKHQGIRFISVGFLSEHKRMGYLIESFIQAFSSKDNVFLDIYGDGPEWKTLSKKVEKNMRSHQIVLHGEVSNEKISEALKQSDCFVLASKGETFGVVYAEAIMCGIPVIATCCGGPESIVNQNNGLLIANEENSSLKEALDFISKNLSKYDKKQISDSAIALYSYEAVSKSINNVYCSVMEEK